MKISITNVPQADELGKVISTVESVFGGFKSDQQIADYVGFTDRQGRYYRLAAEILGLLENNNNEAILTPLGKELIVLDETNRLKKIRGILKGNVLFEKALSFIEQNEEGVSRSELLVFLASNIEGAESTIARRLNTIINWLMVSSLTKLDFRELGSDEKETVYKLNDELDESEITDSVMYPDSIYPANYTNEELDIKESHLQVISLLRKKQLGKIVVPEFQRNQVWKQQQKSRFIESLILNIPVPAFYMSQDLDGNMIIVDGLQRTTSIFEFLQNEFSLVGLEALPHLNGNYYKDLDTDIRARIEDRELLLNILKPTVPMSIVYDIFNRINSNGTPLTRQEIRNCIYIGKSTRLLAKLADDETFKRAIDDGIPSLRMKDREAVLRFFAFVLFDYETEYKGDLDDFLGKTMRRINRFSEIQIKKLETDFFRVMETTFDFFNYNNFRLPTDYSRGRINLAIMEAICVFFHNQSDVFLIQHRNRITDHYYNELLTDPEFLESVRISTGSEKNVKTRFRKTFEILSK